MSAIRDVAPAYSQMTRIIVFASIAMLASAPGVAGEMPQPVVGELTFEDGFGSAPLVFESSGSGGLSGSLASGSVQVGGATFAGTMPIDNPQPALTGGSVYLSNGPGVFSGSLGGVPFAGTMPVAGRYLGRGFGGATLFDFPFTRTNASGAVTAGLGVGGTIMVPAANNLIGVTLTFGPWTSGIAVVTGVATPDGTGTVSRAGSAFTDSPERLTLVTPIRVTTSLTAGSTGSFATISYQIGVPEPALGLLMATGSLVLGAAAWLRQRARPGAMDPDR